MELVEGVPLVDAPLDYGSRRDAARLVFRRLLLDPLFSGLPESIFHDDPHAGNLMVQTQKAGAAKVILRALAAYAEQQHGVGESVSNRCHHRRFHRLFVGRRAGVGGCRPVANAVSVRPELAGIDRQR